MKWRDWKLHYVYQPEAGAPPVPPLMRLFNLLSDPREETDIKDANPWAQSVDGQAGRGVQCDDDALSARARRTPRIPYVPPKRRRRDYCSSGRPFCVVDRLCRRARPRRVTSITSDAGRLERQLDATPRS